MNDTLLRHWAMLRLIPRYPGKIATAEIKSKLSTAGHDITLRSIQRDLNNLSRVLPLVSDDGKPVGWSWRQDASQIDLPALGPQAALTFKLVEAYLQSLLPRTTLDFLAPWFHTAAAVLDGQGNGLAAWPGKIRVLARGLPQRPPAIDPLVQSAIYQGLLLERQVAVRYQPPWSEEEKDYVVNPLALVVRDGQVYLVCTMWNYGDVRHLLLHRMISASVTDEAAPRLDGFDLDVHISKGEFSYPVEPGTLQLEAEFTGYAGTSVSERPLSADQSITKLENGGLLVRATVPDTRDLQSWLLSFGDQVTVLAPQNLREELAEVAGNLAARYQKG